MNNCFFIYEDESILEGLQEEKLCHWLNQIAASYSFEIKKIAYRLDSDEAVRLINKQYLNHDYYTDIITFDSRSQTQISTQKNEIEGDIIISYERVAENAEQRGHTFQEELLIVMAHGLLHLIGFDDHTEEDIRDMRAAEMKAINMFH